MYGYLTLEELLAMVKDLNIKQEETISEIELDQICPRQAE